MDMVRTTSRTGAAMAGRYRYKRMSPKAFSRALDELGLNSGTFARLSGAKVDRVVLWLRGEEAIPHHVAVLCSLMTLPGGLQMAKDVTDHMIQEEPRSSDN